jgi:hypothetical protein
MMSTTTSRAPTGRGFAHLERQEYYQLHKLAQLLFQMNITSCLEVNLVFIYYHSTFIYIYIYNILKSDTQDLARSFNLLLSLALKYRLSIIS